MDSGLGSGSLHRLQSYAHHPLYRFWAGTIAELNIFPLNLVPICHPCNNIKLARVPTGPHEQFLHPYFDQLPSQVRWLFAEVTQSANGPLLQYWAALDPQTYGSLANRLDYHFRELQLDHRFQARAATILAELEAEITEHLGTLDAAQMAAHFYDLGVKEFIRHGNTLDGAAYFAAAASEAYCSGGYCSRPNRKRLHRFLLEVYSTGISLEDGRDQRRAIKKLTEIGKLRPRGPLDIFTALIAAGSIESPADGKQRSRWSRGLRHIASKDVAAQNFGAYLRRKGGICKAADRYARSRRQTESLRNRRR